MAAHQQPPGDAGYPNVALWLGHSNLKSTEIYLRADSTEKLNTLLPYRFNPKFLAVHPCGRRGQKMPSEATKNAAEPIRTQPRCWIAGRSNRR